MRGNKLVKISFTKFHSSRRCFKKIDFPSPDSSEKQRSKLLVPFSGIKNKEKRLERASSTALIDRYEGEIRVNWTTRFLRKANSAALGPARYTTRPWIQLRDRGRSTWNDRRPGMNVKRGGGGGGEKKSTGNSCHPPRRPSLCYLPSYHREKFRGGSPLCLATRLLAFRAA